MKPWQRGFSIERLRSFAAVFAAHHKALVHGAFGLEKERDIAKALEDGALLWKGAPPRAVAIARALRKASRQIDFRGEPIPIEAPCFFLGAIAGDSAEEISELLRAAEHRAGRYPVYLEIFEEDPAARAALAGEGYRWLGTKIMAGSEIKGIYSRRAAADAALPAEERASVLLIDPQICPPERLAKISAEIEGPGATLWQQHYSSYNRRRSWEAFALRGFDDDPAFIEKPAEMSKAWKQENAAKLQAPPRWTWAAQDFPATLDLVSRLGFDLDRVRFMRLSGSGELSRHADITDRAAGLQDGRIARLHTPIQTSESVRIFGWDERGRQRCVGFPAGALCYLDQRKPHRVINEAQSPRVHLVVDCVSNKKLRRAIARAQERAE